MQLRASIMAVVLAGALALAGSARAAVPTVVAGSDYTLALAKDGKVYAWGRDTRGQLGAGRPLFAVSPKKIAGVPPIVHVDGGATHVAAVDWLGSVWTWGYDASGQLGRRAIPDWTRPGRVLDVAGATRVSASSAFTAVLKSNGTVLVWGTFAGQARAPQPIENLAGIVDLRSGDGHVVALKGDGTVWTAGSNTYGELGDGTAGAARATAAQVAGLADIAKIAAGPCGSMALRADGTVLAWGRAACAATAPRNTPMLVPGLAGVLDIAGGRSHSHAVMANGTVMHWDNAYQPAARPGFVAVEQILADTGLETLARLANDTVIVSGANQVGQHGQGHTDPEPGHSLIASLVNVTGIATSQSGGGGVTHYARTSNGDLYAWGSNFEGQLGEGGAIVTSVPRQVAGLPAIEQLAAGEGAAYAVDAAGDVWAWGDNAGFALGDSTDTPRSTPVKVAALSGVKGVAAGRQFALFLMIDGTVRVLGDLFGPAAYAAPAPVAGLANVAALAARGHNAFALRLDGTVLAWGRGEDGLVGDGFTLDRVVPTPVAAFDVPVTQLAVGRVHALARSSDGAAWSWGKDDGSGVLGDGVAGAHARLAPARIAGLAGVSQVAAGLGHSVALLASGGLRSWGTVALGDGAVASRNLHGPVQQLAGIGAIAAGDFVAHAVGADGAAYAWGGGALRTTSQSTFGSTTGDGTFVHRATPVLVLRADAGGNVDAGDWFLDLDATVANAPPAQLRPGIVPVARAALAPGSVSLAAGINFRSTHFGRPVNTYVLGYVPPAFLGQVKVAMDGASVAEVMKADAPVMVQLTPAGWTTVEAHLVGHGQSAPAGNGPIVDILDGVNPAAIPGARFCIGYGEDTGAMLAAGTIAEVLAIEGAGAAAPALPCVARGIYLDGPSTSVMGTAATFDASVVGVAPTGSVQFKDGFTNIGSPRPLTPAGTSLARATLSTAALAFGAHSIGANYPGDTQNAAATPSIPMLHTVYAPAGGTGFVLSGPAGSSVGSEAIFIATVTGSQATGTVQFYDGNATLGPAVPLVGSLAVMRTTTLAIGRHEISASYSGDTANSPRQSNSVSHDVVNAPARVELEISPASPLVGTPVTLTVRVSGTGPTGAVRFFDNGVDLANPVALAAGAATLRHSLFAAGAHVLTVAYFGDLTHSAGSSEPLVVNVKLAIDPAQASADADFDGIPNALEVTENRNPVTKDNDIFTAARLFAMQQYRDFLGREGDAGGIAHWTTQLSGGAQDRSQMVETFFNSGEFQGLGAPVVRLYFAYFLRIPDYGGLNYWIGQFRAGNTLIGISNAFAGSPEFLATYGTLNNGRFVERVYENVLGRAPDSGGLGFWIARLNAGLPRGEMMIAFSESPEYRAIIGHEVYVTMMYVAMLRRSPDPGGFAHWVSFRDLGNSGLTLIGGFLTSTEYRSRFLP